MKEKVFLSLVDAAFKGDKQMAQMIVRKFASKIKNSDNNLYEILVGKLQMDSLRNVNGGTRPLPVDSDSRQSLVKLEEPITNGKAPIFSENIKVSLQQVLLEREHTDVLLAEGIEPAKSIIFQGPPGVGKTMSARWLAEKLGLPLLVLDLATVMSSFLGKTGSNVRAVLEHAMSFPCVLLLDEFDAIAKRRDDDRELGELKRLVTVLLQAIDEWPSTSLLIAATNHGELLDPAIWRRFDIEVAFEIPTSSMIEEYLNEYWPDAISSNNQLPDQFSGMSFSNIDRELKSAKRESIISNVSLRTLSNKEASMPLEVMTMNQKKAMAVSLHKQGLSQRAISTRLEISRPTVKKAIDESLID